MRTLSLCTLCVCACICSLCLLRLVLRYIRNVLVQNVKLNVSVYSQISQWVQQALQFTPRYWNSLLYSLISSGDNSAFVDWCSYSQSFQFSFLAPPGTRHCWVDRCEVIWKACPTPLHLATGTMTVCYHWCGSCDRTSSLLLGSTSLVVKDISTGSATLVQRLIFKLHTFQVSNFKYLYYRDNAICTSTYTEG